MRIRTLGILALACCQFVSTASAQENGQSPENAQAFLSKVVAAGGVQVTARQDPQHDYGVGDYYGRETYVFKWGDTLSWKMQASQDGSPCISMITAFGKHGVMLANRFGGRSPVLNALWGFFTPPTISSLDQSFEYTTSQGEGILLWRQVSAVEVSGTTVTLPITYAGGGLRFNFPNADIAKRAGFAMEVLRLGCDPTADANF